MIQELILVENESKNLEQAIAQEMDQAIKHFERELAKIRTGRAHTSLVEDILITCYEGQAPMTLKSIASISAPEARLITIQPWDKGVIANIEKVLLASDIGITPINDGEIIRLQLPEMSINRREELAKSLSKRLEECKIRMRNIRKDFNNLIRDAKKNKTISENFFNRLGDILQSTTNEWIKKSDVLSEKKEKEITTI
jgi:ribosome recycling factor